MRDAIKPERVGLLQRLGASLQRAHSRVLYVGTMLSPRTYIANPWLRLGAAAVVGYGLGRPDKTPRDVGHPRTVLQAVLRTVLVNVTTSAIRDAMNPHTVVN